jgi:hypothetical protein
MWRSLEVRDEHSCIRPPLVPKSAYLQHGELTMTASVACETRNSVRTCSSCYNPSIHHTRLALVSELPSTVSSNVIDALTTPPRGFYGRRCLDDRRILSSPPSIVTIYQLTSRRGQYFAFIPRLHGRKGTVSGNPNDFRASKRTVSFG